MTFKAYTHGTYSSTFYTLSNKGIKIQIDNSPEFCDLPKGLYKRFFLKIEGNLVGFEGAFMPLFSPHHRYTCSRKKSEDWSKLSDLFRNLKKDPSDMSARKSLEDIIFECVFETLKQIPTNWYLGGNLPQRNPSTNLTVEEYGRKYMSINNYDEYLYEHKRIALLNLNEREETAYRNTLCSMKNDKHSKGMDRQVFDSGRVPFRLKGIEKKRFKETPTSIGGLEGWLEVEAGKLSTSIMETLFA